MTFPTSHQHPCAEVFHSMLAFVELLEDDVWCLKGQTSERCSLDCREIIETMVKAYQQKIFFKTKPVFDGRKNLYSRDHLPIGTEKVQSPFSLSCM